MKLLTLNFLCCARKTCKTNPAAFPLHPKEAELEQVEAEINPLLIQNMLPRLNWDALKTISQEVRRKSEITRQPRRSDISLLHHIYF
jgi:multifunctional methyltransferase subunit TRM112